MSLDNVLAVAGAAREHPGILIVGLIFAVALMGLAANVIAKYIERYRWIAYVGLAGHPLGRRQDDLRRLDRPASRRGPPVHADGRGAPLDTIVALSSGRPPAAIAVVRTSGPAALAAAEALAGNAAAAAPRQPAQPARSADGALIDRGAGPRFRRSRHRDRRRYRGISMPWQQGRGRRADRGAGRHARHAARRAGRIHPPRARQRPHRPDPGRGPRRAARGRKRGAARSAPCAAPRAGCGARSSAGAARCSSCRPRPKSRSIMPTRRMAAPASIRRAASRRSPPRSTRCSPRRASSGCATASGVVVAGPPNAGKSSLVNALAGRSARDRHRRSPGTTRDLSKCRWRSAESRSSWSTPRGCATSDEEVERIGIGLAEREIERADLLLWLGAGADQPPHPRCLLDREQGGPRHDRADGLPRFGRRRRGR